MNKELALKRFDVIWEKYCKSTSSGKSLDEDTALLVEDMVKFRIERRFGMQGPEQDFGANIRVRVENLSDRVFGLKDLPSDWMMEKRKLAKLGRQEVMASNSNYVGIKEGSWVTYRGRERINVHDKF